MKLNRNKLFETITLTDGGLETDMIFNHQWFMHGVYAYRGGLANFDLARRFKLPYKDISLFRAARL